MAKILKSFFSSICSVFTAFILIISLGISLVDNAKGLTLNDISSLFIFSVFIAIANIIFFKTKLHGGIKYMIHLFITIVSSAICISRIAKGNDVNVLFPVIAVIVLHALIFLLIFLVQSKRKKAAEYKSIFEKEKEKTNATK